MDTFALFRSFCQVYSATVLRQLSTIIVSALCAPQYITMRNFAHWSTCSYQLPRHSALFRNINPLTVITHCVCDNPFARNIASMHPCT